jgi:FkbM family methyltransferase
LVYDVGGFNGVYGILAALRFSSAEIVIFEPDETNVREIQHSIMLNNVGAKCRVEEAAICNSSGTLFFSQGGSTGEHITTKENGKAVKAYALKDLPHADLIKIDVEGAEQMVLEGLDYRAIIFLETHPWFLPNFGTTNERLMQLVTDKGFKATEVDSREQDQKHYLLTT